MTTLFAGFAAEDISPQDPAQLSGFVIRQGLSQGVHDPLYVRVLTFSDRETTVCLVILDLIGTDAELTKKIRQSVTENSSVPAEHVAILATHTHGGPAVLSRSQLGNVDAAYLDVVVEGVSRAVKRALAKQQPVTLKVARGKESSIAKNRRNPDGPIDPDVPVLCFDTAKGLAGLLTSYACHPVTLGPDNLQFTRDYPGATLDALEKAYPDTFAAFATGCCGQLNTGHKAGDSLVSGGAARRTFAEAERLGKLLAQTVKLTTEAAAKTEPIQALPLKVLQKKVALPLQNSQGDSAQVEDWQNELEHLSQEDTANRAILEAKLAWAQHWQSSPAENHVEVEIMVMRLGEVVLAMYPGEIFVEFALNLKANFANTFIMTLSYANSAPGYIPYKTAYAEGGYEVDEAYQYYGQAGPFPAEAGELMQREMILLVEEVLK